MTRLINNTPFAAGYVLLPNEAGIDTLYVMVKASFNIGTAWTLCDEQYPPLNEDVYWGEPGQSSLKYPADAHQGKPGTDIAILGDACAPENNPVHTLEVSATIKKRCAFSGTDIGNRGASVRPINLPACRYAMKMPLADNTGFTTS